MNFKQKSLSYLCLYLMFNISNVLASNSSTMQISASVIKFCSIQSNPFEFGEYDSMGDLIAKANVTVTCTAGTVYYIGVSQNTRAMTNNNNDILLYSVYSDQAMSKSLGNGSDANTVSGVGTGRPESITLYAVLKGGQDADNGDYSEMLNISLRF